MSATLETPADVRQYLAERQWVRADEPLLVEPLSGGVSNQVWFIGGDGFRWVMKQALPKLKVSADWFADVRRIEREQAAIRAYAPLLDAEAVPRVLHADADAHTFVMTCAPEGADTWKSELMAGRFDPQAAAQAGKLLRAMHARSAAHADSLREAFDDLAFFDELRIDPFHRHLMRRYPELAAPISAVIAQLFTERSCLVHGDYSPKNLLLAPAPDRRMTALDFEVAHWGNPLFDIAFCTAHLMLKGWALGRTADAYKLVCEFLGGYEAPVDGLLPHLGVMLLARVDGKSPADYVRDEQLKERVRGAGMKWIGLAVADEWREPGTPGLLRHIRRELEGESA